MLNRKTYKILFNYLNTNIHFNLIQNTNININMNKCKDINKDNNRCIHCGAKVGHNCQYKNIDKEKNKYV